MLVRRILQSDEHWGLGLSLMRLGPLEVLWNQLKIWAILGLMGIRMEKRERLYVCWIPLKGMEAAFSRRAVLPGYHSKEGILCFKPHQLEVLWSTISWRLDYLTRNLVPLNPQERDAGIHAMYSGAFHFELSHVHFIKLMNYEGVIKKWGMNEVSGVRVNNSTPVLAKN